MKKAVYIIAIVGMLLLSGFTIPTTFADETEDIIISNEKPEDVSTNVSILLSELLFDLNETHGNPMNYIVGTKPDIGDGSGNGVDNGTYSVSVSGLDWNTTYTWYVNATIARGDYKNETFSFFTLQPDTVYVDDGFTVSTPGWGYDHFDKIQDGIDQVKENGTVHVANGTYTEHLVVYKSITLIGEDMANTNITTGVDIIIPAIYISADYVEISGFTIKEADMGILIDSSNNTIKENTIRNNNEYSIYINELSNDSEIYHNNFINNGENASDMGNNNIWYSSDLNEGNYWDDYDGVDVLPPYRIGDTPYENISGGENNDTYPLMFPFGEIPPIAKFTYTVDKSTITFDASYSYDRDGDIESYYWEFGDGKNSTNTASSQSHSYDEEYTTYKVNLTVTDDDGYNDTVSMDVTTSGTNEVILKIVEPKKGLYFMGTLVRERYLRMALIIGPITIKVNVTDKGSIVKQVNFYIDPLRSLGKPVGNDTGEDGNYTYEWARNRPRIFFRYHVIKVEAIDNEGNAVASQTMIVKRIL